jgi:hypothetical protein
MMRAYGFLDSEIGKENDFTRKARSGFMSPHVYGTPATVTEKLCELFESGELNGLMLIFDEYLSSMPIFAAEVLPVLRALSGADRERGGGGRCLMPTACRMSPILPIISRLAHGADRRRYSGRFRVGLGRSGRLRRRHDRGRSGRRPDRGDDRGGAQGQGDGRFHAGDDPA